MLSCHNCNIFLIDSDIGFDDIFAILMLITNNVDIDCISIVFGMNDVYSALIYLRSLLSYINKSNVLVIEGAEAPVNDSGHSILELDWGPQHREVLLKHLNQCPSANCVFFENDYNRRGLDTFLDVATESSITVLCLGPLTNIAKLLMTKADVFREKVREIVIMGGNYNAAGNAPYNSELNFYLDPVAAHTVVHNSGVPITLVGLEVCNEDVITKNDFNFLETAVTSSNIGKILQGLVRDNLFTVAYDPVASYYVLNNLAFEVEDAQVYVCPKYGSVRMTTDVDAGNVDNEGVDYAQVKVVRRLINKQEYADFLKALIVS